MKCKKVVAYNPDVSVLVELEDGRFALVSIDDEYDNAMISISEFAESFLKFGGFEDGADIPQKMRVAADLALKNSKNIFESRKRGN